ncbi:MAG: sugar phosphate isomerase/epimerase family protein [Spirochaetales bacterium]
MKQNKLRFGLCVHMVYPETDPIGLDLIPLLKEWGYTYVEFSLRHLMEIPEENWKNFCNQVERNGLPVEACCNFFPPSQRITGPEVNFVELSGYTERALKRAKDLGAKVVVFGSSGARNLPEGFSRKQGWEQIVQATRMIAHTAEKVGITIAIEYHHRQEANVLNSMEEAFELFHRVDHPNIQLLSDYYHFAYEQEPLRVLDLAKNHLVHVHFAEVEKRSFPKEAKPEYRSYFEKLREIGYAGAVSVEAFTNNVEEDAPRALAILKALAY